MKGKVNKRGGKFALLAVLLILTACEEASESDWNLAVDEWHETPDVDWYEFVDKNMDIMLSLEVSDT